MFPQHCLTGAGLKIPNQNPLANPLTTSIKLLFKGYRAYAQTELADVICQVKKICEDLGLSYEKVDALEDVRDKEKEEEFLKKYPNEPWI